MLRLEEKTNPRLIHAARVTLQAGLVLTFLLRPGLAGPLEDFYALEDQIVEAHEVYVDAMAAMAEKDGKKPADSGRSGTAHHAPDQRPDVLKKMDALAVATLGKPVGLTVAVGAFMWSWNMDLDLEHLVRRFEQLVTHYPNEPDLDDVLFTVGEAGTAVGKPDDWVSALNRLIKATKRKETRIGALFTAGQVRLRTGKLTEAKAAFAEVLKSGVESDFADPARGYIFEIEHLQVGMVAPEFVAATLDGKKVSLRSLRGKAVLLNFWATW